MSASTSTLYTILAVLTAKPDIQLKAREEVDQVLGSRIPTLRDKQDMPYFQALLEEVLRNAVIASGVYHKAMQDATICGHYIPKGTAVGIHSINRLAQKQGFNQLTEEVPSTQITKKLPTRTTQKLYIL